MMLILECSQGCYGRTDGSFKSYIPSQLRWRGDNKRKGLNASPIRPNLKYTSLRWSSTEQLGTPATDITILVSSVTEMLQTLDWSTLAKRRIRTRIIFYKITLHLVAIYPTTLLTPSDLRKRHYLHSYFNIQTHKDHQRYSFFPRTISQWN